MCEGTLRKIGGRGCRSGSGLCHPSYFPLPASQLEKEYKRLGTFDDNEKVPTPDMAD